MVDCHAPFIAAFGVNTDALTDFKLVIQRENIISISCLLYALHCCFACYYISFPADSSLFFEVCVWPKAIKKAITHFNVIGDLSVELRVFSGLSFGHFWHY